MQVPDDWDRLMDHLGVAVGDRRRVTPGKMEHKCEIPSRGLVVHRWGLIHLTYRYCHLPYRYCHLKVIFLIDTVIFHIDTVIVRSSSISILSSDTVILSSCGQDDHTIYCHSARDAAPRSPCGPGWRQRATAVSTQEAVAVASLYHDDFECLGYPKPTI